MNSIKTTDTVSYKTVLKESKDEANTANKVALAKDANAKTIAPMVPELFPWSQILKRREQRRIVKTSTIKKKTHFKLSSTFLCK
jgi:hypothetical protein